MEGLLLEELAKQRLGDRLAHAARARLARSVRHRRARRWPSARILAGSLAFWRLES